MLRHTLATLAYPRRQGLRGAPPASAASPAAGSRSAGQILAHMGDLMDWAASIVRGQQTWTTRRRSPGTRTSRVLRRRSRASTPRSPRPAGSPRPRALFQGPIADALTHVGSWR
jgi:hypothetical protein